MLIATLIDYRFCSKRFSVFLDKTWASLFRGWMLTFAQFTLLIVKRPNYSQKLVDSVKRSSIYNFSY